MNVYAFSSREYPYQLIPKVVTFPFAPTAVSSDISHPDGIDDTDCLGALQKLGYSWVLVTFTTLSQYAEELFKGILAEFFT